MSPYEKYISQLCYNHFKSTGSRNFVYLSKNGNDMVLATTAIESLEENGYISDLVDEGISFSFFIKDSLIRYMEQEES